ncbi:LysR family transcriptional regulator (plasmid) [Ensifer adhaerens]
MHASILKYFVSVARSGSIRKASEELHVASSAVSRQIKKLEDELGIALFERLSNGLRLTVAGENVLRHARVTLENFELLRSDLGALQGKKLVGCRCPASIAWRSNSCRTWSTRSTVSIPA